LLGALEQGNGRQAQFNHPDLGGMGQWSQGGMIMVGDMFNQGLKYRVDALCNELAGLLRSQPLAEAEAGRFPPQSHQANLLPTGHQLATPHVAIPPLPNARNKLRQLLRDIPFRKLQREDHPANRNARVPDNGFDFIERVLRCDIHIGNQPANTLKLATANIGPAFPQMAKSRMLEHLRLNFRRINPSNK